MSVNNEETILLHLRREIVDGRTPHTSIGSGGVKVTPTKSVVTSEEVTVWVPQKNQEWIRPT